MDSGTDSYLHKKFKKQLSIDPRFQKNEKEKNYSETNEEEKTLPKSKAIKDQNRLTIAENTIADNNESVPNQSTNQSISPVALKSNFPLSSISVEKRIVTQSSNSCISYVVSSHINDDRIPTSFDIKYNEPTNFFNTSSISTSETIYTGRSPYVNEDSQVFDYTIKIDETDRKIEEPPSLPDKNSSGKYVCPYCNLVCSKPSVLQKHIRAHTNERPYPCKSCGFSFKTRSNLYKHCRSRTHANRVMGNKVQDISNEVGETSLFCPENPEEQSTSQKPYKPRFHSGKQFFDNIAKENFEDTPNSKHPNSDITHHINEIISKNNSIVNSDDGVFKKKYSEEVMLNNETRLLCRVESVVSSGCQEQKYTDEPLNLTNKNRKRAMSELSEPVIQKSLIKELLLKNLSASDMQCPYCKMIFQTVTELDVHKYRNCKGKPSGVKYSRSSSVNVASILTQNKNAFDNIPHLQNAVFPLNSPGPFLGKTRLVESDKTKSFSFDSGSLPLVNSSDQLSNYLLSPLSFEKEKKTNIKLFGGEVKVHTSGDNYKTDSNSDKFTSDSSYIEYGGKLSENRVVKSSLQSGGTVLTNKTNYNKQDIKTPQELLRVYDNNSNSPNIDFNSLTKQKFTFEPIPNTSKFLETTDSAKNRSNSDSPLPKYSNNMLDFSQKAVKMLTPNIKQPNFTVSNLLLPGQSVFNISANSTLDLKVSPRSKAPTEPMVPTDMEISKRHFPSNQMKIFVEGKTTNNLYNPMSLVVDGKIIRHVPGMPGPVVAAEQDIAYDSIITVAKTSNDSVRKPSLPAEKVSLIPKLSEPLITERLSERSSSSSVENKFVETSLEATETKPIIKITDSKTGDTKNPDVQIKKFARPNSLALKPTTAALKQHHGLTPTMFNQILISPDTPRVAKKYAHHFLHGNYFSYLGLKSSTRPVYCTLNKTQPFYVPHFKKLSMYSEWRQQDTKQDKLYASNYDTRQKNNNYTIAGKPTANLIIHSSYKFMISEIMSIKSDKVEDQSKTNMISGGYECNDEYTYIRGRGRGRYVCDQCGIRCKKPSMLKKHIRTHSNDRPYTCSHCNFSFKTKGNLTKHMKSKAHTKNYTASGGSSSSTQHSAQSSDTDTDDSGMDSSDESTRQQEHEAAYGLLSLSQKPTSSTAIHSEADLPLLRSGSPNDFPISSEEVAQVSKTNYARNKFLNDRRTLNINSKKLNEISSVISNEETTEAQNIRTYLGKCINRPLTYPYTSILSQENEILSSPNFAEVHNKICNPISVDVIDGENSDEPKSVIQQFHVIQKYISQNPLLSPKLTEKSEIDNISHEKTEENNSVIENNLLNNKRNLSPSHTSTPTLKINDVDENLKTINDSVAEFRKRKFPMSENIHQNKIIKNDEVIDLSTRERFLLNNSKQADAPKNVANEIYNTLNKVVSSPQRFEVNEDREDRNLNPKPYEITNSSTVIILRPLKEEQTNNYFAPEKGDHSNSDSSQTKLKEYDNSAMETLADVATKQVKLEKNTLAKCVASEFLKLATKNENIERDGSNFGQGNKAVNDLIVKSEGNKSCTICSKNFNKPSQLRLHMNIHYLERPFRCDSCSVSFRTKGHLQKHERSASHHNKLSSSPAFSSSEPRPFKCSDCNIAFRIHGHLAKHLRSKMHIMKLECLSKIPFGLYAELERSNSLLTEINTTDGDQCLESLKTLAKKVFINNPSKLNQLTVREDVNSADC